MPVPVRPAAGLQAFLNQGRSQRDVPQFTRPGSLLPGLLQATPFPRSPLMGLVPLAEATGQLIAGKREEKRVRRSEAFEEAARLNVLADQQGLTLEDRRKLLMGRLKDILTPEEISRFDAFFVAGPEAKAVEAAGEAEARATGAEAKTAEAKAKAQQQIIEWPGPLTKEQEAERGTLLGVRAEEVSMSIQQLGEFATRKSMADWVQNRITSGQIEPGTDTQAAANDIFDYLRGTTDDLPVEALRPGEADQIKEFRDFMHIMNMTDDPHAAWKLFQDPTQMMQTLIMKENQLLKLLQAGGLVEPADITTMQEGLLKLTMYKEQLARVKATLTKGESADEHAGLQDLMANLNIAMGKTGLEGMVVVEALERAMDAQIQLATSLVSSLKEALLKQMDVLDIGQVTGPMEGFGQANPFEAEIRDTAQRIKDEYAAKEASGGSP